MKASELAKLSRLFLFPCRHGDEQRTTLTHFFPQLTCYLDARHLGHSDVEKDSVGLVSAYELYDGVAAIDLDDLMPLLLQQIRQRNHGVAVVIGNQHAQ